MARHRRTPGPAAGRVSVIIPFRDQPGTAARLHPQPARLTEHRDFELVLVDNGSREPATRRYLGAAARGGTARVVDAPGAFNFSRLCNAAAPQAAGDYLLFLNNDTEVARPATGSSHALRLAGRPEVGVVGATLLYPDGTVQHAGAVPARRRAVGPRLPRRAVGAAWPAGRLGDARTRAGGDGRVPADAARAVRRAGRLRRAAAGRLQRRGSVPCARAGAGWRSVVTPHARLLHYEGLSRGHSLADDLAIAQL